MGRSLDFLFFTRRMDAPAGPPEPRPDLVFELWRPSLARPVPLGMPMYPFIAWTLFHWLRIFTSRDYSVLTIYREGRLVHRTIVLPHHFKFPFMKRHDLQVAGIWTDPELRGGGLGLLALHEILRRLEDPERTLWYMVRQENRSSIRLAEKGNFRLCGRGERVNPLGLRRLGVFRMTETVSRPDDPA